MIVFFLHFPDDEDDSYMHPNDGGLDPSEERFADAERDSAYWQKLGADRVKQLLQNQMNTNRAKNVIFFLGDGMSIATIAAARTYMGQLSGKPGEESELSFDKFPTSGLSKVLILYERNIFFKILG